MSGGRGGERVSREEIIFDAITNLREELVEEAQEYVFKRRYRQRYVQLAACLALAAVLCFGTYRLTHITKSDSSNGAMPPSADAPAESPDYGMLPENTVPHPEDGEPEEIWFTASVLEVREDCLLVSTAEYGPVEVPFAGLEDLPEIQENNVVTVCCAGIRQEGGLSTAVGVEAVWLAEP